VLDDEQVAITQQAAAGINHFTVGSRQHRIAFLPAISMPLLLAPSSEKRPRCCRDKANPAHIPGS